MKEARKPTMVRKGTGVYALGPWTVFKSVHVGRGGVTGWVAKLGWITLWAPTRAEAAQVASTFEATHPDVVAANTAKKGGKR